ncbi:hypothetical protein COL30_10630 [Bacillus pseudomycoides]|uniref:Uncharacterized protein n=1 Tax=Bacillus pseudomycoides TaxID=64104 RepID=A0A2A8C897_9BACI|nr:hypothetical protein CON79_10525 [Bacillus pseudomycoides]PEA81246.1 hypothetical protein CON99_23655 [Bacillus pseudomycoides]PED08812.1 hypothetical protein COO19_07855 [Bacillus pseudomycoides]PED73489.1 hypothetical protein CON97_03135 [Bacillus pseudomycoides]PEI47227.1 hypothetical protein CN620_00350 [Bacillus pseudomycoides]
MNLIYVQNFSYNSIVTNFFTEGNDETKVYKRSNHFVRKRGIFSPLRDVYLLHLTLQSNISYVVLQAHM